MIALLSTVGTTKCLSGPREIQLIDEDAGEETVLFDWPMAETVFCLNILSVLSASDLFLQVDDRKIWFKEREENKKVKHSQNTLSKKDLGGKWLIRYKGVANTDGTGTETAATQVGHWRYDEFETWKFWYSHHTQVLGEESQWETFYWWNTYIDGE